jgi:hypothetical protein
MKIIDGLVQGPFRNEQEFKQAVLRVWKKDCPESTDFEIENEEKEPGMPDVLTMSPSLPAFFTEFKYAGKDGVVGFQKSQPLFYRQHRSLLIQVLVWDCRMGGRVVHLAPAEVIAAKARRIKLPEDIDTAARYSPEENK